MRLSEQSQASTEALKRKVLMTVLVLSWLGAGIAWILMEYRGRSSLVLRTIFASNAVFHPVSFFILWWSPRRLHLVETSCLYFAALTCAGCMALKFYGGEVGANIELQPLYLWIPVIHMFVFTRPNYRSNLRVSATLYLALLAISVPFIIRNYDQSIGNFTIQLHVVSAILIAMLYVLSSYLDRLQQAQLTAEHLSELANTDILTGIPNRRRIGDLAETEMARFARYGRAFSVMLIDLDHFKRINDTLGHGVGDQILTAAATRLNANLRGTDTMGRWGGEEFLLILPETGFDATLGKATRLCKHISASPLVGNHGITISCGVATAHKNDTIETLIARADVALYAAKHAGRDRAQGNDLTALT